MGTKSSWGKATKKPIEVQYREVEFKRTVHPVGEYPAMGEWIQTLEGTMIAVVGRDYIIKGVEGELYPCRKTIFEKTYDVSVKCADLRRKE